MSEDEQDSLIGKALREQRSAERMAACYKAKAEEMALQLQAAAHATVHLVGGDWQTLRDKAEYPHSVSEIGYPPIDKLLATLERYSENLRVASTKRAKLQELL